MVAWASFSAAWSSRTRSWDVGDRDGLRAGLARLAGLGLAGFTGRGNQLRVREVTNAEGWLGGEFSGGEL